MIGIPDIEKICKYFIFVAAWISIGCTSPLIAQQIVVSAEIENPDSLLIGDHIHLLLSASYDSSIQVDWPLFIDTVHQLEVVRVEKMDTLEKEGKVFNSQRIVVSAYDSGAYLIRPIAFGYKLQGGGTFDTIYTRPAMVGIHTLQVDTSKGIAPIKDPLDVPYTLKEFVPYIIGLAVFVILLIGLLYFILRKKKVKVIPARPKPTIPPHILAKQKLRELEEEKLWQKGEVKLYYVKLSEIIREYIEFRFDTLALESTTDEILDSLQVKDILPTEVHRLSRLLELSDLVKFAKFKPLPDQHLSSMNSAKDFIKHTEPIQEEVKIEKEEVDV